MAFKEGDTFPYYAENLPDLLPMDLPSSKTKYYIEYAHPLDREDNTVVLTDSDGVVFELNAADRIIAVGRDHKVRRIIDPVEVADHTSRLEAEQGLMEPGPVPGATAVVVSKETAKDTVKLNVKEDTNDSHGGAAASSVSYERRRAGRISSMSRCDERRIGVESGRPVHSITNRHIGAYRRTRAA